MFGISPIIAVPAVILLIESTLRYRLVPSDREEFDKVILRGGTDLAWIGAGIFLASMADPSSIVSSFEGTKAVIEFFKFFALAALTFILYTRYEGIRSMLVTEIVPSEAVHEVAENEELTSANEPRWWLEVKAGIKLAGLAFGLIALYLAVFAIGWFLVSDAIIKM